MNDKIDFTTITACGECCVGCKKKEEGICQGCIESDGHCTEWTQSNGCPIHKCTREHNVQFCGLCKEFPCEWLVEKIVWRPNVVEELTKLADLYNKQKVNTIISNYYRYYKSFAEAEIIDLHEGTVSWIIPKEGEKGPALAFGIHLDEENVEEELDRLIKDICAKKVPQNWVITPDSTPSNIIAIMEEKGFKNLATAESEPEPAMLLGRKDFIPYNASDKDIVCRKVHTKKDFQAWIDIVNTALHGWDMIDADNYYTWVENRYIDIYLGEYKGVPVTTAATIRNDNVASLEFVSTLAEYRCKKIASVVCSAALENLFSDGVEAVTLSACDGSVRLYEKFGFKSYFNNTILHYEI